MTAYNRHEHKRHGKHQKKTTNFLKVYTPYLPMLVIIIIGLVLTVASPPKQSRAVLAYSSSMSVNELLQATNQDRAANGLPALKLNSKLISAAQAKAYNMANLNYWSHDPPGCPKTGTCWYKFVNSSGYKYQALGENLAYGFSDANATVDGWMNSPEHRDNMLNRAYVEVGFGYTNKQNYVGDKQSPPSDETIIVAEYAKPMSSTVAVAPTNSSTSAKSSTPQTKASRVSLPPVPATTSTPASSKNVQSQATTSNLTASVPVETTEPTSQPVTRLSKVTGVNLPWLTTAASVIIVLSLVALVSRHALALNKWLREGERYVLNHFVFDFTIISLIGLSYIASQTIGFIK